MRGARDVYHQLVEMSPDAILLNEYGVTTFVNRAGIRLLGADTSDQILERPLRELFAPASAERVDATLAALCAAPGEAAAEELEFVTFDGLPVPVEMRAVSYHVDGHLIVQMVCHDLSERRAAQTALAASLARFDAANRATGEVIWDWDLTNNQIWFNDSFEARFGWPVVDLPPEQTTWHSRLHPDESEALLAHLDAAIAGTDDTWSAGYRYRRLDGDYADILARGVILRDDAGVGVRMIGTIRDMTDLKRAEAELEQRVADRTSELQAVNEELESFCYSVSHDLRAPLRGIAGFTEILAAEHADALDETARGYLGRVVNATRRMGELIDDLLRLSRVSRDEMRVVEVDLSSLARGIAGELRQSDPGRDVTVDIEDGLTALGDQRLLGVVLENLIGNAWKFTGHTADAHIDVARADDEGPTAFLVRDDGAGFEMRYADKLFTPFQRLHRADEFPGTGIGLATVQRIVHRHGGFIKVDSAPGHGATFVVNLGRNVL